MPPQDAGVIEGEKIVLKSKDGRASLTLAAIGNTVGMFMVAADGSQLNLAAEPNGTLSICFYDSHTKCQGAIGMTHGDEPTLQVGDPRNPGDVKIIGFREAIEHILATKQTPSNA